jgi:hypothetical protein
LWIADFLRQAVYLPKKLIERADVAASAGRYTDVQHTPEHARAREELALELDEIAPQGARRMLAQALGVEVEAYTWRLLEASVRREAAPCSCAMARLTSGRCSWGPELSRCALLRGSTTGGWTKTEKAGALRV